MEDESRCRNRVYLPSQDEGVDLNEYLCRYIEREFPDSKNKKNVVYSIPSKYKKSGEEQASLAEEVVFTRLCGLEETSLHDGLWVTFFHNVVYAGHSYRNHRVGKLIIREHDFVIFVKYAGNFFVALFEVKSSYDGTKNINNVNILSDSKVIKNNKRSAQHQLRDHIEVLNGVLEEHCKNKSIQSYIMWPFLNAVTKDPKHNVIKRWQEDSNLHVFEECLSNQNKFNIWFIENIISGNGVMEENFITLLNRYIILSCGIFVNEIHENMLALLTQEQLELILSDSCSHPGGTPMIVHGAAGTGKTLLVLKKLEQLHESGQLNDSNRALYICYWPGIRFEVESKLKLLGLNEYVDTARFYISQTGFLNRNTNKYKHVFMDESEAVCLAFDSDIISKMLITLFKRYHAGNCHIADCEEFKNPSYLLNNCKSKDVHSTESQSWGELWFMVDSNQTSMSLPKQYLNVLRKPTIVLNKVMRSTGYIFNVFKQYYSNPVIKSSKHENSSDICIGHHIMGPPILWVDSDQQQSIQNTTIGVIIDLCSTKGFKPSDVCVLPFFVNEQFLQENVNKSIEEYFVEDGYRPQSVADVEYFLSSAKVNDFLISWALRVKGLEFKVVLIVVDEEDFDPTDFADRNKMYIITSRSTCLLILVSPKSVKNDIDTLNFIQTYPYNINLGRT